MEIYVGIPCYRVASSISGVLERVKACGVKTHLILVNDGSPDNLDEVVATLDTASFLSLTYHKHPENRGYGGAQKTLFSLFLEKAQHNDDLLIMVHGDGQTDESEIVRFVDEARAHPEADFILGTRMLNSFRVQYRAGRPLYKLVGDYVLTAGLNALFGGSLSTYAIGYRAHTKRGVQKLDLSGMTDRHTIDMELMIRLVQSRIPYRELKVTVVQNDTGFSANRLNAFIVDTLSLARRYALSRAVGRRYLIINSDDFGYAPSVNRAIAGALTNKTITSTTLLTNTDFFEDALEHVRARDLTARVGVHLNLTEGKALGGPYKTLTRTDGTFLGVTKLVLRSLTGTLDRNEVRKEIDLQIERVTRAGITPSHLDTHQWSQILPEVDGAMQDAALAHGIGAVRRVRERLFIAPFLGASPRALMNAVVVRVLRARLKKPNSALRSPDDFIGITLSGHRRMTSALVSVLPRLRPGVTELMCHIGEPESSDLSHSYYRAGRARERDALSSPEFREALTRAGVELISFRELAEL